MLNLRRTMGRWWIGLLLLATAVVACVEAPSPDPVSETAVLPPPPTAISTQETAATSTQQAVAAYPSEGQVGETAVLPSPYPIAEATPTTAATAVALAPYPAPNDPSLYLPYIGGDQAAINPTSPPPTAPPTATPQPTPTPIPTVDFAAVRADLQARGQDLAFVKIGFHVSLGGNMEGLDEWMRQLDAAGVPFFLKTADNAQPVYLAQEMMRQSGVPHTLVYRRVSGDYYYSLPNYDLPPEVAAEQHWQMHVAAFPPELDPSLVWMETMNEVDKERHEWLAEFALATARMALRDGYKWAAFGWSSGEPEPAHWQTPTMLELLRLMGEHPDQLAIALHEYSYLVDDIADAYPYKVGRFLELFRIADAYGIPRPTVLITEWGWTYRHVPEPGLALQHIDWASRLYAPYPQVKGAALWHLGGGDTFAEIADEAQRLIDPLRILSLTHYYVVPRPPEQASVDPEQFRP